MKVVDTDKHKRPFISTAIEKIKFLGPARLNTTSKSFRDIVLKIGFFFSERLFKGLLHLLNSFSSKEEI